MSETLEAVEIRDYDTARYLDTPGAIAGYLNAVLAENDAELLVEALDDVARARVMHGLATNSVVPARVDAETFEAAFRAAESLGLKLQVVPA